MASRNDPPPAPAKRQVRKPAKTGLCILTGAELPLDELFPVALLRPALIERLKAKLGQKLGQKLGHVPSNGLVARRELDRLRMDYVSDLLRQERGDLTALETEVVQSLARQEIMTTNVEQDIEERRTFGERLADALAAFGGSWIFLTAFAVVLALWLVINVVQGQTAFDPYPFILLNLVLSCLAAVQAPVIMMSQRRQEAKDRVRSLNDYQVNLKAELEIRHLNEKIDHILTRQWERLAEIREVQIDLLEELSRRSPQHSRASEEGD